MELSRNEADSQRHNVVPCFFQVRRRAAPRAQGPNGPQGWGPSGPLGPFGVGLGGYSEAISNGWPLRMEGNFDWNAISNGRSFGYMGLLPNSAPARLNQPFRFKNIPSKSAIFTPMLSRPAEAPTKTGELYNISV